MYQENLRKTISSTWLLIFYFLVIFLIARSITFYIFVDNTIISNNTSDIKRMWTTGIRYDMRIAALLAAPIFLGGLLLAQGRYFWSFFKKTATIYAAISSFFAIFAVIGSFFYYQTFHTHFDIFIFGLFEDDTKNVVLNLWDDYPILKALLAAITITFFITYQFYLKINHNKPLKKWSKKLFFAFLVTSIVGISILSRGSISTFPLRRANAQVSDISVLNQLTPNAITALSWAYKDKLEDVQFNPVTEEEGGHLLSILGFESIFAQTARNSYLVENPPHVVLNVMESFGSNMLAFDDENKNDLLGSLRQHFSQDLLFKRFIPHGNGTAPSVAALFFHSPVQSISHSSAKTIPLDTPFRTYKNSGYKTIFISSGNMMWRNLNNYLPIQGIDEVYDQNSLIDEFPGSERYLTDWGLPDEYAYLLAEKLLNNTDTPLFISILTVTNHPPYDIPDYYKPDKISLTEKYSIYAEDGQIEQIKILRAFRYASNAFGEFMSSIKNSQLADKIIVAATGDHQMRRLKTFYPKETLLSLAVPFYLYAPSNLLEKTDFHYDPLRLGSHKDILPTLYHLSLSDTQYLALGGRSLLTPQDNISRNFGYNELLWINSQGGLSLNGSNTILPWENNYDLQLSDNVEEIDPSTFKRPQAYAQLLRWNLNRQIKGFVK